ncbi:hypothetical protein [Streptomyces sp. NPDC049040]|uniref:hypothetical protein n=1 Tax=Streptomyces sp. NPDC049040 TaxID=3365593 RepID=UPI00371ACFF6
MARFGTRRPPVGGLRDIRDDGIDDIDDINGINDAEHRRALVLSEVAAEGPVGLYRVLRRAVSGDADAAATRVSGMVRSLPGVTILESHELLQRSHIRESALAGDLTPGQRVALVSVVDRTQHPYGRPRI